VIATTTARRWLIVLAAATLALFALLLATGALLIFRYEPSGKFLGSDSQPIAGAVGRVDIVRTIHRAASFAIVPVVIAAVVLAVVTSVKRVAIGVLAAVTVIVVLAAAISGQAIAWSQVAVFAVVDHIDKGFGPIFGGAPVRFVRVGGAEIGIDDFRRRVVLHVAVLPILLVVVGGGLLTLILARRLVAERRPTPPD